MDRIKNILNNFNAATLDSLDEIKLLKRYDTKFVFCREKLSQVFEFLDEYYAVLEIEGKRCFRYESLYYDTDDYFFYRQHHNKNYDRYKVRFRKYVDSGQCYFEVKQKNNKSKTVKSRLLLENGNAEGILSEDSKLFAKNCICLNCSDIIGQIKPKLNVSFDRITFVNYVNKERLTIDLNLTYKKNNSEPETLNRLAIAELKSEKHSLNSQLIQCLKKFKIYPSTFSKYCVGLAMTEKNIKYNRFKKKILKLNRLN